MYNQLEDVLSLWTDFNSVFIRYVKETSQIESSFYNTEFKLDMKTTLNNVTEFIRNCPNYELNNIYFRIDLMNTNLRYMYSTYKKDIPKLVFFFHSILDDLQNLTKNNFS